MIDWNTNSHLLAELDEFENQDVWGALADCFRPPIVRLGRRLGLDDQAAEDAAQDAFLKFALEYRKGRYDRGKGRLRTWLFGIARNEILHARRKALTRREHGARSGVLDGPVEGLMSRLWEVEWSRALHQRALDRLRREETPETFEIFRLFVLEEVPADAVAARLGVNRTKVYNVKSRLVARARRFVEAWEDR